MINLSNTELYAVEVPKDSSDFEIIRSQDNYDLRQFKFDSDIWNGYQNYDIKDLGEYDFEILGEVIDTEISFDVEPILESKLTNSKCKVYKVYNKGYEVIFTSNKEESFRSLLSANCQYFENPMGKAESCCSGRDCGCMGQPINFSCKEEFEEWQQFENQLIKGKLIILKRK